MSESLFLDPNRSGVFHFPAGEAKSVEAAAKAARLKLLAADAGESDNLATFLRELGRQLDFPDWYGANLDALHDCLTDPDWQPAGGSVLLITGLEGLKNTDPESYATLIEVFTSASEICREAGSPLWILLDSPVFGLPPLPNP